MKKKIKNTAASVKARLRRVAAESGRPFDEVLKMFAIERFIYRLSKSEFRDKFILKGALFFCGARHTGKACYSGR